MKKESFLYICAFLMDGCFALIGLCIPLLALQMDATYDDLGSISAVGALAYSVSCLISGRLSDYIGYRRVMAIACCMVAIIFTAYLFISQIWHLAVLSALMGLTISNFWPPLQAWLGQRKTQHELRQSLGRFNIAWSSGFIVGPALGGNLFETHPQIAFAMCACISSFISLGLLYFTIRETASSVASTPQTSSPHPQARQFLQMAWLANFATFFSIGTVRSLFPKLATDMGISPGHIGYLVALLAVAQLITFYFMAQTERWQFKLGPIVGAQLVAFLGLSLIALSHHAVLFAIGLFLQGMLAGVTFTVSIFYSLQTEGPGGRRTGIHEAIVGSGFLVGPFAGGLVGEYLGERAPYWLAAVMIIFTMMIQVVVLSKKSTQKFVPQAGD